MQKTTWTAQTKSQLVAALARKGFGRDEVRSAADRAADDGFAWACAYGEGAPELNMALITFGDTEVDMYDASLHTLAEVSCDVCNTCAHMPKLLTQVEGIGNACSHCMRSVRDLDATVARWNAMVEEGKLDAEYTAKSIVELRTLAAALAPKPQAETAQERAMAEVAAQIGCSVSDLDPDEDWTQHTTAARVVGRIAGDFYDTARQAHAAPHFEAVAVTGEQMAEADTLSRAPMVLEAAQAMLAHMYGVQIAADAILATVNGEDFTGPAVVWVDANGIPTRPRYMTAEATGSLSRVIIAVREVIS